MPPKSNQYSIKARRWLKRVKDDVRLNEIELTPWEDEFLTSLDARLEKYGRAFVDPDLGAMNAPLSLRQGLKVKQIKNKGKALEKKPLKAQIKPDKANQKPQAFKKRSILKAKPKIFTPRIKSLDDENEV